ncbi:hypothetical protein Tco_0524155 [Tanacetum coccineum]
MTANRISPDPDRTWVDGIRCATQIVRNRYSLTFKSQHQIRMLSQVLSKFSEQVHSTKGMRSIISTVSISLEGFLSSILLLMVIIVAAVIVTVIRVVVVIAIVGVVIIVAIIGVVVFVTIIGIVVVVVVYLISLKLSFGDYWFLHRI